VRVASAERGRQHSAASASAWRLCFGSVRPLKLSTAWSGM
jgi:hypothetical protein